MGIEAALCLNEGIGRAFLRRWTVAAAEFGTVDEREVELFRWRLDELLEAGYALDDALTLTTTPDLDLHLAVDLPRRGCPHATAVRILL